MGVGPHSRPWRRHPVLLQYSRTKLRHVSVRLAVSEVYGFPISDNTPPLN